MKSTFKAGTYKQQQEYKSFSPFPVNKPFEWNDRKVNVLSEEAMRLLSLFITEFGEEKETESGEQKKVAQIIICSSLNGSFLLK